MVRILEDDTGFEKWENATAARVSLKRLDRKGELTDEIVGSFASIHITPAERRLNQEIAADESLDPFHNGMLVPVRLIETTDDVEQIRNNPNNITESDMRELISKTRAVKAFQERVNTISNPVALNRFLELAKKEDNTTAKQLDVLEARLREVSPSLYTEVTTVGGPPRSTGMTPVSPT